jgi:hypothetical protein
LSGHFIFCGIYPAQRTAKLTAGDAGERRGLHQHPAHIFGINIQKEEHNAEDAKDAKERRVKTFNAVPCEPLRPLRPLRSAFQSRRIIYAMSVLTR